MNLSFLVCAVCRTFCDADIASVQETEFVHRHQNCRGASVPTGMGIHRLSPSVEEFLTSIGYKREFTDVELFVLGERA